MAQLLDIYIFVSKTNKLSKKNEKESDLDFINANGTYMIGQPSMESVREAYTKRWYWRNRSKRKVQIVSGLAFDKAYLKTGEVRDGILVQYNNYVIATKGWDLIQKSFFNLWPKGLILAWIDKNKSGLTLLISFTSGVVIGAVGVIVAIMKNK